MTKTIDEQEISSKAPGSSPRRLPVFEGYTVDERLQEFRKMSMEHGFETVPFSSRRGQRLLASWVVHQAQAMQGDGGVPQ